MIETILFFLCLLALLLLIDRWDIKAINEKIEQDRERIDELAEQCDVLARFINEMTRGNGEFLTSNWIMSNGETPALANNEPVLVIMKNGQQAEQTADSTYWPHVIAYKVVLS